RTHYIRVPDDHRIELRGGDGSANPYLAIAAALGAGLDGIKRNLDPGPVGSVTEGSRALPPTLLHAVDELAGDEVITGVLDAAGNGVAKYFADVKRDEFFSYHGTVSPWEIDQYLTAF
ncbi:MAG: glutamine synthetase, partial [Mycobacterium sp.]|nr:glutamine synthetase [Mycobacterium sp.]